MDEFDCLLLHTPNMDNFYLPMGRFMNNNLLPMGMPGLAALLKAHGYRVLMLHHGVELLLDPDFCLTSFLESHPCKAVGITLFWFHQANVSLRAASEIKKHFPETFVFLGGMTCSYFADEIIMNFPQVDAIIAGFAETASVALMGELRRKKPNLKVVPGLVYLDGSGRVTCNSKDYDSDIDHFRRLNYADLTDLIHLDSYVKFSGIKEITMSEDGKPVPVAMKKGATMVPVATGRGCPVVCSYCGGNRKTSEKLYGSGAAVWRPHKQVVADIKRFLDYGYDKVFFCYDPFPGRDDYYSPLFKRIRKELPKMNAYFECWGLPSRTMVEEFRKTFGKEMSQLLISPDSADESLRKRHNGNYYTNEKMWQCFDMLEVNQVYFDVCFSLGLPGGAVKETAHTRVLMDEIKTRYPHCDQCVAFIIDLAPGAPLFERPQSFDCLTEWKRFQDIYEYYGDSSPDTYAGCHFSPKGFFGEEIMAVKDFSKRIQQLRCRDFCLMASTENLLPQEAKEQCRDNWVKIAQSRAPGLEGKLISDAYSYFDAKKDLMDHLRRHTKMD